jgi:methionyl aminopeptidase
MKVPLKSSHDIHIMAEGGRITTAALRAVKKAVRPGITTLELDAIAEKTIKALGGESSFKRVPGYRWTICACVNDIVVHGIPTDEPLQVGDIMGIDVGAYLKGFHTDLSYSVLVTDDGFWEPTITTTISDLEGTDELTEKKRFLAVGRLALVEAIKKALVGNHIGDISNILQTHLEGAGYGVVRELIGHGVGKDLHEPPQVPGRGRAGEGMVLREGMVLAIEAIYTMGSPEVAFKNRDGWTIATADYSMAGLYEQSVAITPSGPQVLTEW